MKNFNSSMADDYHTSQSNLAPTFNSVGQQQHQQQQMSTNPLVANDQQRDEMSQDLHYLSREAPLDGGESTFGAATSYSQLAGSQRDESATRLAGSELEQEQDQEDETMQFFHNRQLAGDGQIQHGFAHNEQALNQLSPDNVDIQRPLQQAGFLVSFMVDARGGAMCGCRHSGVRVIIPPNSAQMPMRITCRYLRRERLIHPPPLMEGEACASKIMEVGPAGAKFLGPVLIEVPHFASLRGKEREIIILRSDSGEVWREHLVETDERLIESIVRSANESSSLSQSSDNQENNQQSSSAEPKRLTRIVTNEFPQYFAIISRIRQEVHAVGPEGSTVNSQVVNRVQAIFTEGALTKRIKIGLQGKDKKQDSNDQDNHRQLEVGQANEVGTETANNLQGDLEERAGSPRPGRPSSAAAKRRSRFLACFGAGQGSADLLNGADGATDDSSAGGDSPRQECNEKRVERRHIIEDIHDSDGEARSSPSPSSLSGGATERSVRRKRHAPVELVPDDYYMDKEPPLILNIEPQIYGKRLASSSAQTDNKLAAAGLMSTSAKSSAKSRSRGGLLSGRRKGNKTQLTIRCDPQPARPKSAASSRSHQQQMPADSSLDTVENEQLFSGEEEDDFEDSSSIIQDVVTSEDQKWRTCIIQTDSDSVTVNYVTGTALDEPQAAANATATGPSSGHDDGYVSGSGDLNKQSLFGKSLFSGLPFGSVGTQTGDSSGGVEKTKRSRKQRDKKVPVKVDEKLEEAQEEVELKLAEMKGQPMGETGERLESLSTVDDNRSTSPSSAKELKLKQKLERQAKLKREKEEKRALKEAEEAAAKAEKLRKKLEKEAKNAEKAAQKQLAKRSGSPQTPTPNNQEQEQQQSAITSAKTATSVKFAETLVETSGSPLISSEQRLDSLQGAIESAGSDYERAKIDLGQTDGAELLLVSLGDRSESGDESLKQTDNDGQTLLTHDRLISFSDSGEPQSLKSAELNVDGQVNLGQENEPPVSQLKPILKQQTSTASSTGGKETSAELIIGSVASQLVNEATDEAVRIADEIKAGERVDSPISGASVSLGSTASKKALAKQARETKERLKREAKAKQEEEKRLAKEAKRVAEEAKRLAEETKKAAELEAKRVAEEAKRAAEEAKKVAELEAKQAAKLAKVEQERLAKEAKDERERLAKEAKEEKERLAKEAKEERERLAKEAKETAKKLKLELKLKSKSKKEKTSDSGDAGTKMEPLADTSTSESSGTPIKKTLEATLAKVVESVEGGNANEELVTPRKLDQAAEGEKSMADEQLISKTSDQLPTTADISSDSLKKKAKKLKKNKKQLKKQKVEMSDSVSVESTTEPTTATNSKSSFFGRLFRKRPVAVAAETMKHSEDVTQSPELVTKQTEQKPIELGETILSEMYPTDPNDLNGEMILEVNVPQNLADSMNAQQRASVELSQASERSLPTGSPTEATTIDQSLGTSAMDNNVQYGADVGSFNKEQQQQGELKSLAGQDLVGDFTDDQEATLVNVSQLITTSGLEYSGADDGDDDEATENVVSQTQDFQNEAELVAPTREKLSSGPELSIVEIADREASQLIESAGAELSKLGGNQEQHVVDSKMTTAVADENISDMPIAQVGGDKSALNSAKARKALEAKLEKEAKKRAKEEEKLQKSRAKEEEIKAKAARKAEAVEAERQAKEAKRLAKIAKEESKKAAKEEEKRIKKEKKEKKKEEEKKKKKGGEKKVIDDTVVIEDNVVHNLANNPSDSIANSGTGVEQESEIEAELLGNMKPINTETEIQQIVEEVMGEDGVVTKTTKTIETKYVTLRGEEVQSERQEMPVEEYERRKRSDTSFESQPLPTDSKRKLSEIGEIDVVGDLEDATIRNKKPFQIQVPAYEHAELDEIQKTPSYFVLELPADNEKQQLPGGEVSPKKMMKKCVKLNQKHIKRAYKLARSETKQAKKGARKAEAEIAVCDEAARQAQKYLKVAVKEARRAEKEAAKAHKKMDKVDKKLEKKQKKIEKRQKKLDKQAEKLAKKEAKRSTKLAQKAAKEAKKASKKAKKNKSSRGSGSSSGSLDRKSASGSKRSIRLEDIGEPVLRSSSRLSIGGLIGETGISSLPTGSSTTTKVISEQITGEHRSPSVSDDMAQLEMSLDDSGASQFGAVAADAGQNITHSITRTVITETPDGQVSEQMSERLLTGEEALEAIKRMEARSSDDSEADEEIDVVSELPVIKGKQPLRQGDDDSDDQDDDRAEKLASVSS